MISNSPLAIADGGDRIGGDFRFGSKAEVAIGRGHVWSAPNNGHHTLSYRGRPERKSEYVVNP